MHRLKNIFIILLTVTLIMAGAVLPSVVSSVFDDAVIEKSGSRSVKTVQLNVSDEENRTEKAELLKKLAMMKNMSTIPVTENETTMTEEDACTAADLCLQEYKSAGIIPSFDITYWSAEPYMAVESQNVGNYFFFWAVNLVNEYEPYHNLLLHIDDETGKILYINYISSAEEYMNTDRYTLMESFSEIYLQELGILQDVRETDETNGEFAYVDGEIDSDNNILHKRYCISDDTYGDILIDLYVNISGCIEVYFPE